MATRNITHQRSFRGLWPALWHGSLWLAFLTRLHCSKAMQSDGGPLDDAAPQSLWDIQLVTRVTVSRGSSAWDAFSEWLMNREAPKASLLVSVPTLLSTALAHYADVLYQNGRSLTILLQLLTFVQRQYPDLKVYMKLPWAAAKRWALLAPTKHRTPVPEQLVMALITVAWLWGWPLLAGILFVSFRGVCRIGEVLRAKRGDLLLPSDYGGLQSDAFLHVGPAKTSARGGAKAQHVRIPGPVGFLQLCFGGLPANAKIWPYSSESFCRRWKWLISALKLPESAHLTPGGLRGGGAVAFYVRRGQSGIADLLWQMRIKRIETLAHYLQEVAALSTLAELEKESQELVSSLGDVGLKLCGLTPMHRCKSQERSPLCASCNLPIQGLDDAFFSCNVCQLSPLHLLCLQAHKQTWHVDKPTKGRRR